ncbi:MAG TPA: hypothetical protein VFT29_00005 [Gemmatimonadaceae bacterium]|nr:hypothetical protein [Gemmatimonadaceae bacterium]
MPKRRKSAYERVVIRAVRAIPLAVIMAGIGTLGATMIAAFASDHPDRSVGWMQGLLALYFLMPPLAVVGLVTGLIVGYRQAGLPSTSPWSDPPPELVRGHYAVALVCGWLAGITAIAFVIPTMARVVLALDGIIGELLPGALQVLAILWLACVLMGGWDVGIWVVARIDGIVHRLRTRKRSAVARA